MKVTINISLICVSLFLFMLSCTDSSPEPIIKREEVREPVFNRGEGSIIFTAYKPLEHKPVTVYYYIPEQGNIKDMPVLFSLHGAERDGKIQRDAWKYFAGHYGIIVLAPQFSKEYYKENDYQFGGIFTDKTLTIRNSEEKWTYKLIEAIFDYFKNDTGNQNENYDMFGHSAGAQFVHRYLIATPEARVRKAVAANAGSWTLPSKKGIKGTDGKIYGWPYAIKNLTEDNSEYFILKFFEKTLYIQLGTADINEQDPNLPKDAPSMVQGKQRLERGHFFFDESKNIATEINTTFKFQLKEVKGAAHSTLRMVYGKSSAASFDVKKVEKEHVETNSAFNLIYNIK